ncbi:hypothetical protein [Roseivirga sp. E12]|uniref:hypothetical protein n=1 Tax=Roseivirga sp. E12 TaxID=2819237 RepID=UPI001ABCDE4D|nr:hypothetical protein [Roseivirga sp. E12]MBO3697307.1 hypothetical protein [Roseivirga sp. E12]
MQELEAKEFAQKHVDEMNAKNTDIEGVTWVVKGSLKLKKGYYFDYTFEFKDPENPPMLAGAPGFIVLADGNIELIDWTEYSDIKSQAS